jgi:hypothetical protein
MIKVSLYLEFQAMDKSRNPVILGHCLSYKKLFLSGK